MSLRSRVPKDLPVPSVDKTEWPWTDERPQALQGDSDNIAVPRISIITPSYNQGIFLEETIRSVLLQGYPNLEYIIIDGGSNDQSVEIIQKYEPWLKEWISEPDRGQSHAINKGWAHASGDLIAYLNSDDFYLPDALMRVAKAWNNDDSIAMITGGIAFTDQFSNIRNSRMPYLKYPSPLDLSILDPSDWFLPQQSSFFVRSHLDQVGRWVREALHYTMDRELMYRLCRNGRIKVIDDILAGDRHHEESKRLNQTLSMYREDAAALAYCTWGGSQEVRQRERIGRWRLGQGHYHVANRESSRLSTLSHLCLAAYYRPNYLRSHSFIKKGLHTVGLQEPIEAIWRTYKKRSAL